MNRERVHVYINSKIRGLHIVQPAYALKKLEPTQMQIDQNWRISQLRVGQLTLRSVGMTRFKPRLQQADFAEHCAMQLPS